MGDEGHVMKDACLVGSGLFGILDWVRVAWGGLLMFEFFGEDVERGGGLCFHHIFGIDLNHATN